jgi:hypothetical protein
MEAPNLEPLNWQSASFIKPFSLNFTQNHIFVVLSILGLGLFTYLSRRYFKNTEATTNQYYTKPDEQHFVNILLTGAKSDKDVNGKIVNIFWNGDMNSTYLLIDSLLQDKIIQPLYIERYTILKHLEYESLENLTQQYNTFTKLTTKTLEQEKKIKNIKSYLEYVARIKHNQQNELTQINTFRKLINKQYPEFQKNFLPTLYITTIAKDLEYTSKFYSILKDISPLMYNGIEFLEQVLRFIKHYSHEHKYNSSENTPHFTIGYARDNKNINLIEKINNTIKYNSTNKNNLHNKINNDFNNEFNNEFKLDMPLVNISNGDIRFLASSFFPNDLLKFIYKH